MAAATTLRSPPAATGLGSGGGAEPLPRRITRAILRESGSAFTYSVLRSGSDSVSSAVSAEALPRLGCLRFQALSNGWLAETRLYPSVCFQTLLRQPLSSPLLPSSDRKRRPTTGSDDAESRRCSPVPSLLANLSRFSKRLGEPRRGTAADKAGRASAWKRKAAMTPTM
ncbi:hypothetical protein GW7_09905 [Heterocephalus glaber]|uniref:Uncharacterized protein n=1 Tax=Heterocephalus glaber TaxID=10181 RepID=G5BD88_HETGA|nr:hypothetical protein GW7_09905 [Heterocephalus glaber]